MTDTIINVKDGNQSSFTLISQQNGDGTVTFYHAEDSVQRAALIAATIAPLTAGESHIGEVGGKSIIAVQSMTRPADTNSYVIGDLVANSTTAGSVTPISLSVARKVAGTGVIGRVRLATSKTGLAGSEGFRVHLFKTSPTSTVGDNAIFSSGASLSVNGVSSVYMGAIDITMAYVFNDGARGFTSSNIMFDTGAGVQTIFALLETRSAYTPVSSEVFTLSLEISAD